MLILLILLFTTHFIRIYVSSALQQLQLGVEFEGSTRMQDTSVSFGYQLDVPKANLLFKGTMCTQTYFPINTIPSFTEELRPFYLRENGFQCKDSSNYLCLLSLPQVQ